jgi:hypothetical protein
VTYTDRYWRFWSHVDASGGPDSCWMWTASKENGYGQFWAEGRNWKAHRYAYEKEVGPIPKGLDLDHTCHTSACKLVKDCPHRACVNPAHLEPVTRQVNLLRGNTLTARQAKLTHCPRGHSYEGCYVNPKGDRICRVCAAFLRQKRRKLHGRSVTG